MAQSGFVPIGEYEYSPTPENFLGRGAFGEVWKGRHKRRENPVAVKKLMGVNVTETEREIKLLQSVIHDNLVSVYASFMDAIAVHIVMELCSTDLNEHLQRVGKFVGEEMQIFVQQLAKGYNALYNKSILHRDIKPQNILVGHGPNSELVFKLADFGCSKMLLDTKYASTGAGTPLFMAPEVGAICFLGGNGRYDYRADFWSLGVVFNKCCGGLLMEQRQLHKLFHLADSNSPQLATAATCTIPSAIDADLRAIIIALVRPRYEDRITAEMFFNHSYVRLAVQKRAPPAPSSATALTPRVDDVVSGFANVRVDEQTLTPDRPAVRAVGEQRPNQPVARAPLQREDGRRPVNNISNRIPVTVRPIPRVNKKLFVLGGIGTNGNILDSIDIYDFNTHTWHQASFKLPAPAREWLAVASFNNRLYAFGGKGAENHVDIYDNEKHEWMTTTTGMSTPRFGHAVCLFNNRLIIIGGWGLANVDAFDPLTNSWTPMPSMSMKRAELSVCVLGDDIYAIGGWSGGETVDSVEKLDGVRWSPVASMKKQRWGHCAAVVGDELFVFGGLDESTVSLASCEVFSLSTCEWRIDRVKPMPAPRWGAGAVSYEGRIYVFGGFNSKHKCLDSMIVYDPTSNKWETVVGRMPTGRRWAGSALM